MFAGARFEFPLSTSDFVWLLGSLCRTHRVAWDPALALQMFPPPYSLVTLHEAARQYGFQLGETDARSVDWTQVSFPVVAFRSSEGETRPVLIAKTGDGRALYFEPGSQEPRTTELAGLATHFDALLLLVARDQPGQAAEDPANSDRPSFGFRWFAAERLARSVSLSEAAIAAVKAGPNGSALTPEECSFSSSRTR